MACSEEGYNAAIAAGEVDTCPEVLTKLAKANEAYSVGLVAMVGDTTHEVTRCN